MNTKIGTGVAGWGGDGRGALVAKEIRLLLPAYGAALALTILPLMLSVAGVRIAGDLAPFCFMFGVALVALASFGREFNLKTFPALLAQPTERRRIWRTKSGLLAGAVATLYGTWCLACQAAGKAGNQESAEELVIVGVCAAALGTGGLWTTLLLRQVTAAFWFTILVPCGMAMGISAVNGTSPAICASLLVYSAGGFWLAKRMFFNAQEVGWTGGTVSLPGWRSADRTGPARRFPRPRAALFWKEIQLQQVSLLVMGVLFLLHLGAVWLRRAGGSGMNDSLRMLLTVFGGSWLLVPIVVAGSSIAEERRLGMQAGNLCLPVPAGAQFRMKLLIMLLLGVGLSTVLCGTAEALGSSIGANKELPAFPAAIILFLFALVPISLLCFYASSMAGSFIQALAISALTALVMWAASTVTDLGHFALWRGPLFQLIYWPTLSLAVVWFAFRNYRRAQEGGQLWLRNLRGFIVVYAGVAAVTVALYHRVWELGTPLEPPHGTARLGSAKLSDSHYPTSGELTAILPDGRLYDDYFGSPNSVKIAESVAKGKNMGLWPGGFVSGSNWTDVTEVYGGILGVRADGTLWRAGSPRFVASPDGSPTNRMSTHMVQSGSESNWAAVASWGGGASMAAVLLKRDGSLWYWNDPLDWRPQVPPPAPPSTPQRVGTESNWVRMAAANSALLWKQEGSNQLAYRIHWQVLQPKTGMEPEKALTRMPELDNVRPKNLVQLWFATAGVREDGSLWLWLTPQAQFASANSKPAPPPAIRLGKETDWTGVTGEGESLLALKADGSLWGWHLRHGPTGAVEDIPKKPFRFSMHNDWVSVGSLGGGFVSLAADGSLWFWENRHLGTTANFGVGRLLGPSRKPTLIENILSASK